MWSRSACFRNKHRPPSLKAKRENIRIGSPACRKCFHQCYCHIGTCIRKQIHFIFIQFPFRIYIFVLMLQLVEVTRPYVSMLTPSPAPISPRSISLSDKILNIQLVHNLLNDSRVGSNGHWRHRNLCTYICAVGYYYGTCGLWHHHRIIMIIMIRTMRKIIMIIISYMHIVCYVLRSFLS